MLDKGRVQQYDHPQNIINAPENDFVEKLLNSKQIGYEINEE